MLTKTNEKITFDLIDVHPIAFSHRVRFTLGIRVWRKRASESFQKLDLRFLELFISESKVLILSGPNWSRRKIKLNYVTPKSWSFLCPYPNLNVSDNLLSSCLSLFVYELKAWLQNSAQILKQIKNNFWNNAKKSTYLDFKFY